MTNLKTTLGFFSIAFTKKSCAYLNKTAVFWGISCVPHWIDFCVATSQTVVLWTTYFSGLVRTYVHFVRALVGHTGILLRIHHAISVSEAMTQSTCGIQSREYAGSIRTYASMSEQIDNCAHLPEKKILKFDWLTSVRLPGVHTFFLIEPYFHKQYLLSIGIVTNHFFWIQTLYHATELHSCFIVFTVRFKGSMLWMLTQLVHS